MSGRCLHFACVADTLWCPFDEGSCYIQVFDSEGQPLRTICNNRIQNPKSVHTYNENLVLVAAANGLFSMDQEGQDVNLTLHGCFKDVCVNDAVIATLESNDYIKEKVHLLDNTGPPKKHRHFSLDSNNSRRLLLVASHVYVSFHSYSDSFVCRYTLTGEQLQRYGRHGSLGPGEFNEPLLCCWDYQMSVLVADRGNHQLQVLDKYGGWTEVKPPGWKWNMCPLDVVVTQDRDVFILYYLVTQSSPSSYHVKQYSCSSRFNI